MRITANVKRRPPAVVAKGVPIPAPTGGWDAISALPNMPADRAVLMDNWIPRPGWIEPRTGFRTWATGVGSSTDPVETVMAYNGSTTASYVFGIAGGTIYDCTNFGAAVPTVLTGFLNSRFQFCQFSNPANQWLVAVNGENTPILFDGTTWQYASITGSGIDQRLFSQVNAHNGRLWFVQKHTTDPVYMQDVAAIAGTAVVFPVGQFLTKGGYIIAIGTWTVDTRQTVNEYIAFISSRGEVLVYQGTDPSTAETWQLVGRYVIGAPVSERCFSRIAGDLLIITVDGVVGMSEMLSTDRAAANRVSLTSTIMNAMSQATSAYRANFGWQIIEYPLDTLTIINIPIEENVEQVQYVMNTITGAWTRFTGINANCWEVRADDVIFFGGNDGTVYQWDVFSSDDGDPIVCQVTTAYNSFGNSPQRKRYTAVQPLMRMNVPGSDVPIIPEIGIATDFSGAVQFSTEQPATPPANGPITNWLGVSGSGHYVAIATTITINYPATTVSLELNGYNITAESGAFV